MNPLGPPPSDPPFNAQDDDDANDKENTTNLPHNSIIVNELDAQPSSEETITNMDAKGVDSDASLVAGNTDLSVNLNANHNTSEKRWSDVLMEQGVIIPQDIVSKSLEDVISTILAKDTHDDLDQTILGCTYRPSLTALPVLVATPEDIIAAVRGLFAPGGACALAMDGLFAPGGAGALAMDGLFAPGGTGALAMDELSPGGAGALAMDGLFAPGGAGALAMDGLFAPGGAGALAMDGLFAPGGAGALALANGMVPIICRLDNRRLYNRNRAAFDAVNIAALGAGLAVLYPIMKEEAGAGLPLPGVAAAPLPIGHPFAVGVAIPSPPFPANVAVFNALTLPQISALSVIYNDDFEIVAGDLLPQRLLKFKQFICGL